MKRIKNLSESDFLKLLFGFFAAAFLIAAVCMPDRGSMLTGLWQIVSQPSKISTNYFAVGGYAATFLNMGLVALCCLALYAGLKAAVNNVSTLAFLLTLGFCSWGIHIVNMWPSILGVCLYCLVKKEKLSANVNAMLFSTGITPLITELMVRYPNPETVGFSFSGILLSLAVGLFIGFFLPAGLANAPKVHHGMDLYSAAVPVGMTAFFLQGLLYKTMGVALPAAPASETLQVASRLTANVFCCAVFGICIIAALALGCKPKDYWKLLRDDSAPSFSAAHGNAAFLMNVGVYGLYILGSLVFGWLSGIAGGSFGSAVNAQAIMVGLCYANGLSPITRKYGWQYSFIAGLMHYLMVTTVPNLHGGYCLYNGGFTAAFVCLLLTPVLEKFFHTKEERRAAAAK